MTKIVKKGSGRSVRESRLPASRIPSGKAGIDAFLRTAAAVPVPAAGRRGRLVFGMDATMSRQSGWDRALAIQAHMFHVTKMLGGLDVQLVWFRGFDEFYISRWASDPDVLAREMTGVQCRGGHTRIGRVLDHALRQCEQDGVEALVYVGDCVEEELDPLCDLAGRLGLKKVPVFVFQEGQDPLAMQAFSEIARLSGGACQQLTGNAAQQLRALLEAVAVYASGGWAAFVDYARTQPAPVRNLVREIADNRKGIRT